MISYEEAVGQTVELLWDTMTPTWSHCNGYACRRWLGPPPPPPPPPPPGMQLQQPYQINVPVRHVITGYNTVFSQQKGKTRNHFSHKAPHSSPFRANYGCACCEYLKKKIDRVIMRLVHFCELRCATERQARTSHVTKTFRCCICVLHFQNKQAPWHAAIFGPRLIVTCAFVAVIRNAEFAQVAGHARWKPHQFDAPSNQMPTHIVASQRPWQPTAAAAAGPTK